MLPITRPTREEARRARILQAVGEIEADGLILHAQSLALREIAESAPPDNAEARAMLEDAEAIDRQRQVKVLTQAHLQRLVGDFEAKVAPSKNAAAGPQRGADGQEAPPPQTPSEAALRAFLSALRAALARQPDLKDAHGRPLAGLVTALAQAADDTTRADLLLSADLRILSQALTPDVALGYARILSDNMPGWNEVRAAAADIAAACSGIGDEASATVLRALLTPGAPLSQPVVSPNDARTVLGIMQGVPYPAGKDQQLAQATLRVITIRIALAEALSALVPA